MSAAAEPLEEVIPATPTPIPATPVAIEAMPDINDIPFRDNQAIYQYDDPGSVVVIYVTVRMGNAAENTNYTWAEVNSFNKWLDGSRSADLVVGAAEAIVQFGDETGPLPGQLGYDAVVPNATIHIRGASSSEEIQKSYKIELNEDAGKWRGQSTLALNKHIYDLSRMKNKLNFDLMKQIPNLVSLRTQFVHLYVKDQTVDPWSTKFVDYGLFTQIEQVNRRFLKNHGLDPNGHLYKATSFDFDWDGELIRVETDPLYNEEEFSNELEIKGNRDHSKLIEMLDAVNDSETPIDQSFEEFFDEGNYFTWMAYTILSGNVDTQNQNFFLYSPLNSKTWYIIPWDYDSSYFREGRLKFDHSPDQYYERGIANYWGGRLHSRVLKVDKYRRMLDDKINELMEFLTPERFEGLLAIYKPVVEPYVFRLPDVKYLNGDRVEFDYQYATVYEELQRNYRLYLESLEQPMPFYYDTPEILGNKMLFRWDESYSFEPQDIIYHFEISKDFDFKNIVYKNDIVNLTSEEIDTPEPGRYFWRVISENETGKFMYSIESYYDSENHMHDGMRSFIITPDGEVIVE
ncbi:MAG: CotH kinase family protein [Anaerolineales bacterium]|nr:CotH kinase family protein [Anaerolineales bacterium]